RVRIVEGAAGNRALRAGVFVFKNRIGEPRVRWITESFADGPTIIRPGDAVVDLFPGTQTDVVDEHATGAGLESEGKRIPQTHRPDRTIVSSRLIEERVISRNNAG